MTHNNIGYVRLGEHGMHELIESLTWKVPTREQERAASALAHVCRSSFGLSEFDVVLRMPYWGVLDRLQQQPPRFQPPTLTWVARRTYAGSLDLEGMGDGLGELRRLLVRAALDLRDPTLKALELGSDAPIYPR